MKLIGRSVDMAGNTSRWAYCFIFMYKGVNYLPANVFGRMVSIPQLDNTSSLMLVSWVKLWGDRADTANRLPLRVRALILRSPIFGIWVKPAPVEQVILLGWQMQPVGHAADVTPPITVITIRRLAFRESILRPKNRDKREPWVRARNTPRFSPTP